MYAIRVDATRHVLSIEVSGRLATAEALRAVSQAFALAEASGIRAAICDARGLGRGPGGMLMVAATIAICYQAGMRIALVGAPEQQRVGERLISFSGIGDGFRFCESMGEAEAWVEPTAQRVGPMATSTELRHADEMLGVGRKSRGAVKGGGRRVASGNQMPAA